MVATEDRWPLVLCMRRHQWCRWCQIMTSPEGIRRPTQPYPEHSRQKVATWPHAPPPTFQTPTRYSSILHNYREKLSAHPSLRVCDAQLGRRLQAQARINEPFLHPTSSTSEAYNCSSCHTSKYDLPPRMGTPGYTNPLLVRPLWTECDLTSSQLRAREHLVPG